LREGQLRERPPTRELLDEIAKLRARCAGELSRTTHEPLQRIDPRLAEHIDGSLREHAEVTAATAQPVATTHLLGIVDPRGAEHGPVDDGALRLVALEATEAALRGAGELLGDLVQPVDGDGVLGEQDRKS